MLKNKFIKIIAVILISSFVLSSSVYAKMQIMSEDDLTKIDAETGITIALNTDIYLKATSIGLFTTTAETSGIVLPNVVIDGTLDTVSDNYTNPSAVNVNSTLVADVGTASGKTWLNISGLNIYNPIGLTSKGIYIEDGANDRILGDLYLRGVFMGRTLTSGTPGYTPPGNTQTFTMGSLPSITVAAHAGGGLDLYASLNAYINTLEYRFRPADSSNEFKVSGIYACQSFTGAPEYPSTWVGSGNLRIGNFAYNTSYAYSLGSITTPLYASMDVGASGGKTYLCLNLPLTGSIRVNDFRMDSAGSFGPIAVDGMTMRMVKVTLYNI